MSVYRSARIVESVSRKALRCLVSDAASSPPILRKISIPAVLLSEHREQTEATASMITSTTIVMWNIYYYLLKDEHLRIESLPVNVGRTRDV